VSTNEVSSDVFKNTINKHRDIKLL